MVNAEQSPSHSAPQLLWSLFQSKLIPAQTQLECQGFSLLDRETLDDWEALEASVGPQRGKR